MNTISKDRSGRAAMTPLGWIVGATAAVVLGAAGANAAPSTDDSAGARSSLGGYLAGRHAERANDVFAAADFMALALKADPDNPELLSRTLLLDITSGRFDHALPVAEKVVEKEPDSSLANLLLAVNKARQNDFLEAGASLSALPRRGGNELLVPLLLAWVWMGEDNPDESMRALGTLENVSSLSVFYELHRGLILDMADRAQQADASYAKVTEPDTDAPLRAVLAYAAFLQRQDRVDEARAKLRAELERTPESVVLSDALAALDTDEPLEPLASTPLEGLAEALFDVASALHQESASRTALVYARLALFLRPDFPAAKLLAGTILDTAGLREEAIAFYRSIDPESPLSWTARLAVATALADLKRADEAVAELQAMGEERTDRSDPLVALGDILRANERFEEAVVAYDEAFARMQDRVPPFWGFHYARGIALERAGAWQRAEADLLRALELQPDHAYVLNYLGYSWVDRGKNLDRAMDMLERAMQLRPDDGYITDSMGWVHYRLGAFHDAVSYLERAVELRPYDPTINDHLGDAYWRVGRTMEARFQWHRALNHDPDPKLVPELEKKLESGLNAADASSNGG